MTPPLCRLCQRRRADFCQEIPNGTAKPLRIFYCQGCEAEFKAILDRSIRSACETMAKEMVSRWER